MDAFQNSIRISNLSFVCDHSTICRKEMMAWTGLFGLVRQLFWVFYNYGAWAALAVILVIVVYVIYKSYFSPILIVKGLTDVGFDHIKSPTRRNAVVRSRLAGRLGAKLPPPYPNGWFALIESGDLKPGQVKAVDALGENFCVYRTENGQTRCLDAYCPHLGANIAVGGKVVADCVQCPFHNWKFSGQDGECVGVPGQDNPPRGVRVRAWETQEVAGAVWIWYHANGGQPSWTLPTPSHISGWKYRGRNEYVVACHIQDIPENGADVCHLNSVHSPSLFTQMGEKYPFFLNFIGRHTWSAEWARGEAHTASIRLMHEYIFGKLSLCKIDINATQMGPGAVWLSVKTSAGPLIVCQSVTPLSPCEQHVVHRIFSPWYNAPIAAVFVHAEAAMFERDLLIWNNKRFVHSPAYVRADKSIRAFRAWYAQFYSEQSTTFQVATRKHCDPLEW